MTSQRGVEASAPPVITDGMDPIAESCDTCPIRRADELARTQGHDAAAHYLRVQVSELSHKLALSRRKLRDLGVDPDIAYMPQEHG